MSVNFGNLDERLCHLWRSREVRRWIAANSYDQVVPFPTSPQCPRSIRFISTLIAACVLTLALPACASGNDSAKGTTRTIPVLWAGTDASGAPAGGVEKATVTVKPDQVNDPGFTLDLKSIRAKNAGPQWVAATSSAAAVATILSAADPGTIAIHYGITGSIDGPSGGAILTVGTLAAIRGAMLDPKITMTGTISPDGSVGAISGVPEKLRGAAKAGFTKVLLPMNNLRSSGEASTTDMVAYGASLGLEVTGVLDVAAAYAMFTGSSITPALQGRYVDAPAVTAAGTATAVALLDRLDTAIAAGQQVVSTDSFQVSRDQMREAIDAGRPADAYAIGYDAYTRLVGKRATAECGLRQRSKGDIATQAALLAETSALRSQARMLMEDATQRATLEQLDEIALLSVPFALGWSTYVDAILAGIENSFAGSAPPTPSAYCLVAAALATSRADLEVFQADALAIVKATPNPQVSTVQPAQELLSDYTDFLISAGDANRDYVTTVIRRGAAPLTSASGEPDYLQLALDALSTSTNAEPSSTQTLSSEILRSAEAITYFVIGVGLVANLQSYGLINPGISGDASLPNNPQFMENAVENAASNVNAYALELESRSIIPGSASWSARWGVAASNLYEEPVRVATGRVTALNELWYDVVNAAIIYAATAGTQEAK